MRDNERYIWEMDTGYLKGPYEGVAKVELNLGNTCNLSCRTWLHPHDKQWLV